MIINLVKNNHSLSRNKSYCSKTWQNSSCARESITLLSWTANYCHFPSVTMHFTVWFNLVHDSEGKVPFSCAALAQALLSCRQLLKLRVLGTVSLKCAHTYNPPKKHLCTQHTNWEWVLFSLLYIKRRVCHRFSFKLNSESCRLQCSACKAVTPDQDQYWNVMAGTALQHPSCTGKGSNRAAHVMKLINQSTVTCYFHHGKRVNYKVIVEERPERSMGRKFSL